MVGRVGANDLKRDLCLHQTQTLDAADNTGTVSDMLFE